VRIKATLAGAIALLVLTPASASAAAECAYQGGYPGDAAPKKTIAAWMANGAEAEGIPRELPVMGALVASGMRNLKNGEGDAAGFFQMRRGIWDQGPYAGYPEKPELQLKWFTDQSKAVRERKLGEGDAEYGRDPSRWGEWAADVLRPPEHQRGLYQPRLDEARSLIAAGCAAPGPGDGGQVVPDSDVPVARLVVRKVQRPLRSGAVIAVVACPNVTCTASARGTVAVPGAARVLRLRSAKRRLRPGQRAKLRLKLGRRAKRAVRRGLRHRRTLRARLSVRFKSADGSSVGRRTVKLRR